MSQLDATVTSHFFAIKGGIFLTCFFFAAVIQSFLPHQNAVRGQLRNWKVNLTLGLFNSLLFAVLCGSCVCEMAEKTQLEGIGLFHEVGVSYVWQILVSIVFLDFVAYVFHRIYHRVPVLWRFHSSHHSDEVFEASTAVRFHPGELLLSLGVRIFVVWALGIPVLALLLFEVTYILFNLVEHSDFNLPESWDNRLSWVFITPSLHRLHHSVESKELNSNFGTIFSVWDRLFGTYRAKNRFRDIEIGLGRTQQTFLATLAAPFRRVHL